MALRQTELTFKPASEQRRLIRAAVRLTGSMPDAAARLGCTRGTLWARASALGITSEISELLKQLKGKVER